ncbi:MAG: hypothetical protein JWR90_3205 [Marmoricola sp.]|nr:hypothetical protein [Marmoricola sp.]
MGPAHRNPEVVAKASGAAAFDGDLAPRPTSPALASPPRAGRSRAIVAGSHQQPRWGALRGARHPESERRDRRSAHHTAGAVLRRRWPRRSPRHQPGRAAPRHHRCPPGHDDRIPAPGHHRPPSRAHRRDCAPAGRHRRRQRPAPGAGQAPLPPPPRQCQLPVRRSGHRRLKPRRTGRRGPQLGTRVAGCPSRHRGGSRGRVAVVGTRAPARPWSRHGPGTPPGDLDAALQTRLGAGWMLRARVRPGVRTARS